MISNENKKTDQLIEEKVDKQLLEKYVAYELDLEAKNLRLQSNPSVLIDVSDLKMDKSSFEKMINNFLTNERNIMRQVSFEKANLNVTPNILHTLDPQHCYNELGEEIPCPTAGGGQTVSCTGTFTGMNSTNTIVFVAGLNNNSTSIVSTGFGFGGVAGAWAPVGSINQTLSQNVISYQQYYTDTNKVSGINYTQVYLLYGNIYQGNGTVHAMKAVQ